MDEPLRYSELEHSDEKLQSELEHFHEVTTEVLSAGTLRLTPQSWNLRVKSSEVEPSDEFLEC